MLATSLCHDCEQPTEAITPQTKARVQKAPADSIGVDPPSTERCAAHAHRRSRDHSRTATAAGTGGCCAARERSRRGSDPRRAATARGLSRLGRCCACGHVGGARDRADPWWSLATVALDQSLDPSSTASGAALSRRSQGTLQIPELFQGDVAVTIAIKTVKLAKQPGDAARLAAA